MQEQLVETTNDIKERKSATFREAILSFESEFLKQPSAVTGKVLNKLCPVKHTFVDGAYIREIFMPKGTLLTSKIHKVLHPYFVMQGKCSVITEEGIFEIVAPYHGLTKPATKRLLQIHEDTIWITVHVTKERDLEKIEKQIIAETFKEALAYKKKEELL